MRKYRGTPLRNVVLANTLVLVAYLVTFSESQWNQFHPGLKRPTASWGFAWPPSAALPLDPAGDSAAHSSPCTFSLTPPAELCQNNHLIISFDIAILSVRLCVTRSSIRWKRLNILFQFVLQCCDTCKGHVTCKIVSEMTYNVSSGTLNLTIPYQSQFLQRDAMQARSMLSCGVCPLVCLSRS